MRQYIILFLGALTLLNSSNKTDQATNFVALDHASMAIIYEYLGDLKDCEKLRRVCRNILSKESCEEIKALDWLIKCEFRKHNLFIDELKTITARVCYEFHDRNDGTESFTAIFNLPSCREDITFRWGIDITAAEFEQGMNANVIIKRLNLIDHFK